MNAFDDVDVLDLTQSIAGPLCTQMLAALGANVVKVEPPDGDTFRELEGGRMFTAFNHGPKRSISVDLKSDEGQELVRDLAGRADVIVESFRPGVMGRFGLDYETIAAENEDVVYCSITGFGQDGPYSDYPAYDPVIQAMSGLMSVIGYPDRPPARIGASVIDCGTGANAAFMVSAALRDREGGGEHIDISLFDVAVSWMTYWIARYDETGETPTRAGSGFHGIAPNAVYYVGDDPFYLCGVNQRFYERTCRAIDREDLIEDDRFETNEKRWEHREELREELESTFAEYDREEVVERLTDHGVPAGPLKEVDEVAADEHVAARGMLMDSHNVRNDRDVTIARLPLRTADWRAGPGDGPPELGAQTRDVLASLGYDDEEVEALLEGDVVFETGGD